MKRYLLLLWGVLIPCYCSALELSAINEQSSDRETLTVHFELTPEEMLTIKEKALLVEITPEYGPTLSFRECGLFASKDNNGLKAEFDLQEVREQLIKEYPCGEIPVTISFTVTEEEFDPFLESVDCSNWDSSEEIDSKTIYSTETFIGRYYSGEVLSGESLVPDLERRLIPRSPGIDYDAITANFYFTEEMTSPVEYQLVSNLVIPSLSTEDHIRASELNNDSRTLSSIHPSFTSKIIDVQMGELMEMFPDGKIPVTTSLMADRSPSGLYNELFCPNERYTEILSFQSRIYVVNDAKKRHFRIGLIPIIPSGANIEKGKICTKKNKKTGITELLNTGGKCSNPFQDISGESYHAYSINKLIFQQKPFTSLGKVKSSNSPESNQSSSSQLARVFSIHATNWFFERKMKQQGVTETRLGTSPTLSLIPLETIALPVPPLLNFDSGLELNYLRSFFHRVLKESGQDTSEFDQLAFVLFTPGNSYYNYSFRSFADLGGDSFTHFPLENRSILKNTGTFTLIHEIGHQLLYLQDLYSEDYDGDHYGIQYPIGAPNPHKEYQRRTCLMSGQDYPGALKEDSGIWELDTATNTDLDNIFFCAISLQILIRGTETETPCRITKFYDGECGECSSENFLQCNLSDNYRMEGFIQGIKLRKIKRDKKARISIKNIANGETVATENLDDTTFSVTLPPGTYAIRVSGKRFKNRGRPQQVTITNYHQVDIPVKVRRIRRRKQLK